MMMMTDDSSHLGMIWCAYVLAVFWVTSLDALCNIACQLRGAVLSMAGKMGLGV